MATKALPQAKVNTTKFLPSSKKTPANLAKQEKEGGALLVVETKLIKVENLIKTNLKIEADSTKKKQRRQQLQQREVSEDELEEQPEGEEKKAGKKISLPRLSFLERIKSFLFKMILTFVTIKLLPHLGKIAKIIPSVIGFVEGVLDWSGKLFDAMAGFVAGAYELRDKTAGFMKQLGGDLLLGTFQAFEGAISKVIEASIIIMMASGGDGGLLDVGGEMLGNWLKGRVGQQVAQQTATQLSIPGLGGAGGGTAASTAGTAGGMSAAAVAGVVAGAGLLASALGEGAFQLRKMAKGPIERTQKKFDKASWLDPRKYFHGATLAGQKLLLAPIAALGFILDIVGAPFRYAIELLRMPFLDEKGKKKQAKNLAKFDARIREDFRKGLNMLTLGFAFKEKGQFGNIYGNKGAQKEMMSKMASGGRAGGVTRSLKKKPKRPNIMPTKIQPGRSVADKKKFDRLFPDTENYRKATNKQGEKAWWDPLGVFTGEATEEEKRKRTKRKPVDPIGYLEETYKTSSAAPFFGPLMGATIKLVTGDEPSKVDYTNVGKGLNAWVYSTFGEEVKEYAQGGEVTDMFMDGKDLTMVIANSVEKNTKGTVSDVMSELKKQLALQPLGTQSKAAKEKQSHGDSATGAGHATRGGPSGAGSTYATGSSGEYGDILDLISSVEAKSYDTINSGYIDGLSTMTIAGARRAVLDSGIGSGAMGRYQQMPQFVLDRARSIGLDPNKDLFSPENQDKLAILLINGAGYKAWKAGTLSTEKFAYRLAGTWRGLPEGPSNLTYQDQYASGNKAHTTWDHVMSVLNGSKSGGSVASGEYNKGARTNALPFHLDPMEIDSGGPGGYGGDFTQATAQGLGPTGKPGKIYLHWTAGGWNSTGGGYHAIIRGDGSLLKKLDYSQKGSHTESRNTGSVGLSVAAMIQDPKAPGGHREWPKPVQLETLTTEAARIAKAWGWTSSDIKLQNIMTHGEAGSGRDGWLPAVSEKPYNYGPKVWGGDGSRWDLDKLTPGEAIGSGGPKLRQMIKSKMWTGGYTKSTKHVSWLGERGKEFVMDADSTAAMDSVFPGLLSALNKADYDDTIGVLRNYAQYELGAQMSADVPDEMIKPFVIPMPGQQTIVPIPVSMGGSDPFQTLDNGH